MKTLFILRPTTGQVQHKAFFKVGPDARPQNIKTKYNVSHARYLYIWYKYKYIFMI